MASPQLQQGYTPIANELLEALFRYRCSGAQKDILLAVIRATIGFHQESRPIGIAYLAKLTERNRKKVAANVADLIRLRVLTEIQPHTSGKCRTLALNKNFEEWVSPQRERVSQTGERFPNGREGIHHMEDTVSPNQETGYPPNGSSKKETLKETSKDSCSHDEAVRTVGGSQQSFQETTVPASVSSSARSEGRYNPTSPMNPTGRTVTNPIRSFQAWWAEQYRRRFGAAYMFNYGKEGKLIKAMLSVCGEDVEQLKQKATVFFDSTDAFTEQAGYTLGVFYARFNALNGNANRPANLARGAPQPTGKKPFGPTVTQLYFLEKINERTRTET